MIQPIGSLPLNSNHRVNQISFHPSQPYLAVQSHDRSVEVFRIRTPEEVKKKRARKQKRVKEKGKKKEESVDVMQEDEKVELADLFTPYLIIRASGKIRSFDFSNAEVTSKGGVTVRLFPETFSGQEADSGGYYRYSLL